MRYREDQILAVMNWIMKSGIFVALLESFAHYLGPGLVTSFSSKASMKSLRGDGRASYNYL